MKEEEEEEKEEEKKKKMLKRTMVLMKKASQPMVRDLFVVVSGHRETIAHKFIVIPLQRFRIGADVDDQWETVQPVKGRLNGSCYSPAR